MLKEKTNSPETKLCSVCLAPGDSVNHLDHLAVIAYALDIPVVVDEPFLVDTLKKYYPQVKLLYIEHHAQILEFLSSNYDVLFVSSANYRKDLSPLLEILFRKKMQFWYCPHGNSDKPVKGFGDQNFSLIYGDQMEDRLQKENLLSNLTSYARTGNYRYTFYKKHASFYDALVEDEVFSKFAKKQTTIIYAPTWQDLQTSSSLFEVGISIIDQLPSHYNLIIKLHPWIDHHHQGFVAMLKEKYQEKPNIVILSLYPLVLPLLERSDIYLGDFSSISYDYLYYNRPMFFFDPLDRKEKKNQESSLIHGCGISIPEKHFSNLFSFIESNKHPSSLLKKKRAKLFQYAFGKERSFQEIKEEVNHKINLSMIAPTG
ncbi:hypothetical protein COB21_02790 [Candidatus Aerophobetes bacterium]|uniref:CDP-glycerol--glycerophosphate glycerophosphotransferase n=1 Tax=Aerophobetes bacterium TaxID=2030807 RepID=A0A2A4X4Q7_UNCAE|nr:MAG: hypothetical protein COB21_02790 [Candidatus Aerophobetes bacterium]